MSVGRSPESPVLSLVGHQLGEFTVDALLGEGGMGQVYRAHQTSTSRDVALKVIHPAASGASAERFRREAVVLGRLRHPNIVTVFASGDADGLLYLAMELLEGVLLSKRLDQGPLPVDHARVVFQQLADALAHAHRSGVVHRDLKSSNIMLTAAGEGPLQAHVLDFGLAKLADAEADLTRSGSVMGSAPYMAPEQWRDARDVSGAADIYALGCVMYRALSGEPPFRAHSPPGYMNAHLNSTPRTPEVYRAELRDQTLLMGLVRACLAKDPGRRPTAEQLLEQLDGRAEGALDAAGLPWGQVDDATDDGAGPLWSQAEVARTSASEPGPSGAFRRRSPLVLWGSLGVVAAVAVTLGGVLSTASEPPSRSAPVVSAAPDARVAPEDVVARNTPEAGPSVPVSAADATSDDTAPLQTVDATTADRVWVTVVTDPDTAAVLVDGEALGTGTVKVSFAPNERPQLVVRSRGYRTHRETLDATRAAKLVDGTLKVRLKRPPKKRPKPDSLNVNRLKIK